MRSSLRVRTAVVLWNPIRSHKGLCRALLGGIASLLATAFLVWGLFPVICRAQETSLVGEERAKLDTFEGVTLDKADKVYVAKDYPRALAEYDAFILQFPESKLVAYAIHRKARSLQWLEKRFEAMKVYEEVLDFFPNDVKYAAASLFRIGECHQQNGDVEKAIKTWLELADDADYAKEPLAAVALNHLAENYLKQGKAAEGAKRYEQVALTFRASNPHAAMNAIANVRTHYVRTQPNAEKLRAFYVAARTFGPNPQNPAADEATDALYWTNVVAAIQAHGTFTDLQKDQRDTYYRYWAGQMQGKMVADDTFQIALAQWMRVYEKDDSLWAKRLDKQFADRQKEGNYGRVVRWIGLFAPLKDKADEYYQKLDFAKMSNADVQNLVVTLVDVNGNVPMAKNALQKVRIDGLSDDARMAMIGWLQGRWQLPGTRELAVQTCRGFSDPVRGKMQALRYFHWRCQSPQIRIKEDFSEGLALAGELVGVPELARETFSIRGNLLQWSGKYEEAIKAYQQADNPPTTLFLIADCQHALGKLEPAVTQLREIENFFKAHAAVAALRIAYLYRDAGIKDKYVSALRGVLKKYPQSGQSSEAHQRLEEMGLPIGGGVDADAS